MDVHEAKTHYAALVATAEAAVQLRRARDLVQLAGHGAQAAASLDVLFQAAMGLTRELGQTLLAVGNAPGATAEARDFVALLRDRLATMPCPEPTTSAECES